MVQLNGGTYCTYKGDIDSYWSEKIPYVWHTRSNTFTFLLRVACSILTATIIIRDLSVTSMPDGSPHSISLVFVFFIVALFHSLHSVLETLQT